MDCETTGLTDDDEIIELAIVLFTYDPTNGDIHGLVDKYVGLRESTVPCSEGALSAHGLNQEVLRGKSLNHHDIFRIFSKAELVFAHNAEFDKRFLLRLYPDFPDRKWVCTMRHVLWAWEGLPRVGLDVIAAHYNIQRPVSHRAYADAMTVLAVLRKRNRVGIPHIKQLHDRANRKAFNIYLKYSQDEDSVQVTPTAQDDELIALNKQGLKLVLWTREHLDFINAYLADFPHGSGRVLQFDKVSNARLNLLMTDDYAVELCILESDSSEIEFSVVTYIKPNFLYEASRRHSSLRGANVRMFYLARELEKTNLEEAVRLYETAMGNISGYAGMQLLQGVSWRVEQEKRKAQGISGHIEIVDRLTLSLIRLGRGKEAYAAAIDYFFVYNRDLNSPVGQKILRRVSKHK